MKWTKWTPGPWHVEDDDSFAEVPFIPISAEYRGANVCEVYGDGTPESDLEITETDRANARLISAAPTMAEYIKKLADTGDVEAIAIWESINGTA